ncbi:DUF2958 domain-containing protein [Nostoc ellipsosporum NOK]|nr:DUF2958 domain-containing protein [Nostoc ellipsosporum NOK]
MSLFTKAQLEQLIKNGENRDQDHFPVVRLFMPGLSHVWLINEIDPHEQDIAFGLCDLGMGFPELGYVSLDELKSVIGKFGGVTRDLFFEPAHPMSVYADAAHFYSYITVEKDKVAKFVKNKLPGCRPE